MINVIVLSEGVVWESISKLDSLVKHDLRISMKHNEHRMRRVRYLFYLALSSVNWCGKAMLRLEIQSWLWSK